MADRQYTSFSLSVTPTGHVTVTDDDNPDSALIFELSTEEKRHVAEILLASAIADPAEGDASVTKAIVEASLAKIHGRLM